MKLEHWHHFISAFVDFCAGHGGPAQISYTSRIAKGSIVTGIMGGERVGDKQYFEFADVMLACSSARLYSPVPQRYDRHVQCAWTVQRAH